MPVTHAPSDQAAPIRLPRLSANEAQALARIAQHGAAFAVALPPLPGASPPAGPAELLVGLATGAAAAVRESAGHRIDLEWAGAALRLHLPPQAARLWLAARLPCLPAPPLPLALESAAMETLLEEALAALAAVSPGGPVRVVPSDAAGKRLLPHAWTLTVRCPASSQVCHAVLEADALGLMLLAALLGERPATGNGLPAGALPVRVRAVLGATTLGASQLRSLAARDVVLLDTYAVDAQGGLWLDAGQGQGVRVRAEQDHYVVTHGWTRFMTQTADTEPATVPAEPLALDDIPVRLTFDLGEREVTLAELQRLQPGTTFALQRPLDDGPVMIRANGALVGTGTLVEIDGRVGVMVAALGAPARREDAAR